MSYIIRKNTKDGGPNFAKGKKTIAIDDRTGFKKPYREMVFEPGTNYFVHFDESDEEYSVVCHPQNFVNKDKLVDKIALKYAHPDVELSIGAIVSADKLGI